MEEEGFIERYSIDLDIVDDSSRRFIAIRLKEEGDHALKTMEQELMRIEEITEIHMVTGECTYLVKAALTKNTSLAKITEKIQRIPHFLGSTTYEIVKTMRSVRTQEIMLEKMLKEAID